MAHSPGLPGEYREKGGTRGAAGMGGLHRGDYDIPPMQSVVQSFSETSEALSHKGFGVFFDWTVTCVFGFTVQSFSGKKEARPACVDKAGELAI